MSDAVIGPLAEKDIPSYHDAYDAVAKQGLYMSLLQAPALADFSQRIRDHVARGYPHVVARHDGRVVGWCEIVPGDAATCRDHVGTVSMGLLDEYRGQGLGGELMQEAILDAMAKGITRIQLLVRASNLPAVKLYEKMGFAIEGTQKFAVKYNGVYDDLHIMAQLVGDASLEH
jgi:putative acetyltransferase